MSFRIEGHDVVKDRRTGQRKKRMRVGFFFRESSFLFLFHFMNARKRESIWEDEEAERLES